MVEFTAETTASKGTSENNIRTAIPKIVKEALKLNAKDKLIWTVNVDKDEKISVTINKKNE